MNGITTNVATDVSALISKVNTWYFPQLELRQVKPGYDILMADFHIERGVLLGGIENGAQFPTDISKMIKRGTNMIQAVGYFGGNYAIAIASMRNLTSLSPSV